MNKAGYLALKPECKELEFITVVEEASGKGGVGGKGRML